MTTEKIHVQYVQVSKPVLFGPFAAARRNQVPPAKTLPESDAEHAVPRTSLEMKTAERRAVNKGRRRLCEASFVKWGI